MFKAAILTLILAASAFGEVVQGTVLEDHSGAPVAAASVKVRNIDGTLLKEMDTDRAGHFAIAGISGGEYLVSISKTNYAAVNVQVPAEPETAATPVLRLIKYGVISGHLTSPRMGGNVSAVEQVSAGEIPRSYSGSVDVTGNFRIFGIPPGQYQLVAPLVAATSPEPVRGMALFPDNTQPREFVFTGGDEYQIPEFTVPSVGTSSISGKVFGPGMPQLFSLALIESEHPSIRLMTALTAEGGAFHFDKILPGTYDLYASSAAALPHSLFAHIRLALNSQKVDNLELVLKPGRPIEFEMVAKVSDCSPDGVVTLQAIGTWGLTRDMKLTAPVAPAVSARFENVAPGPFNIGVRSNRGKCVGVTTTVLDLRNDTTPGRVMVSLEPPSSIHGPSAVGTIVVLRDVTPGREAVQAIVASTAEFRFDGLHPGRYCVSTLSVTDSFSRWSPESVCPSPIIDLAAGESRGQ